MADKAIPTEAAGKAGAEDLKTQIDHKNVVDKGMEFRLKNRVIDLYPIRLRDWPDASKLIFAISFVSLADLAYLHALDQFQSLLAIVTRAKELGIEEDLDMFQDMTDQDYKYLRKIISQQNDINMDRLMKDVEKISGRKNGEAPTSQ